MSINIPTRKSVRKAGDILFHKGDTTESEILEAMKVLSLWRISHAYPMGIFNDYFQKKIKKLDLFSSVIAQRLKRTPSIVGKLN